MEDELTIILPQIKIVNVAIETQSLTVEIPQIRIVQGTLTD